MSSETNFVLSPFISMGYQGFSPGIYYDSNSTIIQILGRDFEVIDVTPEYIILAY
jgi:hypothetical protein